MIRLYKQTIGAARRRLERAKRYAEATGSQKTAEKLYKLINQVKVLEMEGLEDG